MLSTGVSDSSDATFLTADSSENATFAGNLTVSGNLTVTGTSTTVDTVTMNAQNAIVFEGATADDHEITLTTVDPTGDRTISLPNVSGTIPVLAAASATAVTSTPEELNVLDGITAVVGELNALDIGSTAVGTAVASKAVILDSNKDYTGLRNLTVSGELDAATGDFSGAVAIDGAVTIGSSLAGNGAPFIISNTNNGNNIDIKTTSSNSLVHALKIHSHGLFEAKQGAVFNEDSNDVDFRVESNGSTHMFFVDAGSNKILMSSNPADDTQSTPHDTLTLALAYSSSGADGAAGLGPRLAFKIPDDEDNPSLGGGIAVVKESADDSNSSAAMTFALSQNDETLDEAVRISSTGNFGIGTTAPHEMLHVEGPNGTQILIATREDTAGGLASLYFKCDSTGNDVRKKAALIFRRDDPGTRGTGVLHICVDGANDEGEAGVADSKMKFSANGEISITKGRTNFSAEEEAFSPGSHNGLSIDINGQMSSGRAATNTQTHRTFSNPNGTVGTISTNGSSTTYGTSSDYRLKENIVTDWDATTLINQLKPSKFNFKTDVNTEIQGFLAHEVSSIVPQAVTGEKDAVYTADEAVKGIAVEGQPNYQSIDHSHLIPLLVKALQELNQKVANRDSTISALETRIESIEQRLV